MSNNKKIVRFDEDNKIVIENDNAKITKEGTTSKIEGVYEIADCDVEKLLVLINNNTTVKTITAYSMLGKTYMPHIQILTSDEATNKALSVVSKEYDELMEKYKELRVENDELYKEKKELMNRHMTMSSNFDNLLEKIKKYNKYRLFNKIKID